MKLTILGTCRQRAITQDYTVTNIQENISYTYSTKEILQVINFCKYGNLTPEETLYTFRTPMLSKTSIIFNSELSNEFNTSNLYIIEIAGKKTYKYNDKYIHQIAIEDKYNVPIKKNDVIQTIQTKEEIEEDILKINELLNKKIIIISHLVTINSGDRYLLKCWLEEICNKHNILFIDPIKELYKKHKIINIFFVHENKLLHYTDEGDKAIGKIYNEFISKIK